jgi:hypothetical protein
VVSDAGVARDAVSGGCSTLDAPPGPFAYLSAGNENTCGIRTDGTLACWGTWYFAVPDPFPGTYTHVSRQGALCAVKTGGELACWGTESFSRSVPAGAFVEVATGESAACARRADGSAVCWGMGAGYVPPGYAFDSLTGGAYFFCGLVTGSQAAVCWEPRVGAETVQIKDGPFVVIDTGRFYACGLRAAGDVSCWSTAWPRRPGDDGNIGQLQPPAEPFITLTTGEFHACGLRTDGRVTCWGANTYGQSSPPAGVVFVHVSAGSYHTCGVTTSGEVVCWGGACHPYG